MKRAIAYSYLSTIGAAAAAFALMTIAACNGTESDEGTAEEALTAVEGAANTCGGFDTKVGECLDTLKTCLDAAASQDAIDACHAAMESCAPMAPPPPGDGAPPPPPKKGPPPGGDGGQGGGCQNPPPPDGSGHHPPPPPPPPPPGDGGAGGAPPPPPPPPPPPGGGEGGGTGEGGAAPVPIPPSAGLNGGADGAGPCDPGQLAAKPCMDTLKQCVDGGGDPAACFSDAQACVKETIQASFEQFCQDNLAKCAELGGSDAICEKIAEHCADGVPLPPPPPKPPAN